MVSIGLLQPGTRGFLWVLTHKSESERVPLDWLILDSETLHLIRCHSHNLALGHEGAAGQDYVTRSGATQDEDSTCVS